MTLQKDRLNLLFLILRIIYPPIALYITKVDGSLTLLMLAGGLSLIVNMFNRSFYNHVLSMPLICWFLWSAYAVFNFGLHGMHDDIETRAFFMTFLMPLYTLIVVSYIKISERKLILTILISLFGYMLLALIFDEYKVFYDGLRFGVKTNANFFAVLANFSSVIALLAYFRNDIGFKWFIPLFVVFSYASIISGSKTSFGICVLSWFFLFLAKRNTFKFNKQIVIIALGIFACLGFYFFFVKDSVAVARFSSALQDSIGGGRAFGDRGSFYQKGFELFEQNPVTGIGLRNFKFFSGMKYTLHTEYMVQLAECGLIGSTLFVLFYGWIIRGLAAVRKKIYSKPERLVWSAYVFGFVAILVVNTTLWTYDNNIIFIILGLCIRYIRKLQDGKQQKYDGAPLQIDQPINGEGHAGPSLSATYR